MKDPLFFAKRTGDMAQFCGARRAVLSDGKAAGVEVVDIWNHAGLALSVYPGRGMDIGRFSYKGMPVSYHAKPGVTSPAYYENTGMNWLRSFFAGMLTTCGLSNVGGPDSFEHPVIGAVPLGLHGRVTNTGAEDVCVRQGWRGDEYQVSVAGKLREACLHMECWTLEREIGASFNSKEIWIRDSIMNNSDDEQPLMLLYHINVGYPLLDAGARFFSDSVVIPCSPEAVQDPEGYKTVGPPIRGAREKTYFHTPAPDASGWSMAMILKDALQNAFYVKFKGLPKLTQWKMESTCEYVFGIEPGNCHPIGRRGQEAAKELERIKPWGEKRVELMLGMADGDAEITQLMHKGG
jgi:hypothetical protein